MDLLAESRDLYAACSQSGVEVAPGRPIATGAAAFLQALGYVAPVGTRAAGPILVATDPDRIANRQALLAFAARLDRVFRLRSGYATGVYFFGAQCRRGDRPVNAGGRGTSLRTAFESCIGEAVERSAVRAQRSPGPVWLRGFGPSPERADPPAACSAGSATNGCAAGAHLADAQLAALLELIERDALMLWWYGGRRAGPLRLDPGRTAALDRFFGGLRLSDGRRVWLLDLTTDIGVPVVAALSCHADGSGVLIGSAASPDPVAAAQSATLEMCQMHLARELADEAGNRPAGNGSDALRLADFPALEPAATAAGPPSWIDVTSGRSPATPVDCLAQHLERLGLPAVWQELTDEGVRIPTVRVVVPGLQGPDIAAPTDRLCESARRNRFSIQEWRILPAII